MGHELGCDPASVTDVVLSERKGGEFGKHASFKSGERPILSESVLYRECSRKKHFTALAEDGSDEEDR